ncbi:MAG: translation initiation factor IF-2 [Nitrospinae bacterium]|nr:translation initiation factor IF-2 [Nitrospinota bacterium]
MGSVRIYSLAKELKVDSKKLIQELERQGIQVKSHMSTIDQETADLILEIFGTPKEKPRESLLGGGDGASRPIIKETEEMAMTAVAPVLTPVSAPPLARKIRVSETVTVKELAEKLNCKAKDLIRDLMGIGIISHINQILDLEIAANLAKKYGYLAEIVSVYSDELLQEEEEEGSRGALEFKSPVVTVMGHVDHGKTSLLDAIRQTNVIGQEVGGITQHIGAYEVEVNKGKIVFLDTPGHEAFAAMRARGAKVTDIVVLVVAADDGVMPQTREAIAHARAAKVPIVVAVNKIDKPNANPDKVKRDLAELGLNPEEWGGESIFVEVSAKKRVGIEELLEMILLQAEVLELKANRKKLARGVIIEARLDKARGPVATVLIQEGTLRVGDPFVAGVQYGKVRAMINSKGKKVKEASPATPVEVLGLSGVPQAGDTFMVVSEDKRARQIGTIRLQKQREEDLSKVSRITLSDLFKQIQKGAVKELNLVIKADVQGSAEALSQSMEKLSTEEVKLKVVHSAVGGITETDVLLASAANAVIIGFNVRPTPKAQELVELEKVDLRLYNVIYDIIADIKAAMEGMLEPTYREKTLGRVEVRALFHIPKVGVVAGAYVTDGNIPRSAEIRVIRDNIVVHLGRLSSLRRFKEDVSEVHTGYECGIGIDRFSDLKEGDIIEAFLMEKVARKS